MSFKIKVLANIKNEQVKRIFDKDMWKCTKYPNYRSIAYIFEENQSIFADIWCCKLYILRF